MNKRLDSDTRFLPFSTFLCLQHSNPGGTEVKNLLVSAGNRRDMSLIPGSARSPAVGNGHPLQYSCLENSMDRGAWWPTVHGHKELDTTEHTCIHSLRTHHLKINGFLSGQRFLLFFICLGIPVVLKLYDFLPSGLCPLFSDHIQLFA